MAIGAETTATKIRAIELPERYELRGRVAVGGMSSLWCAHDHVLGRTVAIKVLSEHLSDDEAAVRRFEREALAAARVSAHPNVVTTFDVGEAPAGTDGPPRPFIVMEYLPGGTVAQALRAGSVELETALRWLGEAAAALDYAHAHGVVHRDIKPANLLLDNQQTVHVGDFGIALVGAEDTITRAGEVIGTAAYLAPECALGAPATNASDRYALAVAAFELLVGRRPFLAEHYAAQARQHVEEDPPRASRLNSSLPRALDPVLARGMAKQPEERFGTAVELVEAIERSLSPRQLSMTVYEPEGPSRLKLAGGLAAAAAALALLVAVLLGIPGARRNVQHSQPAFAAFSSSVSDALLAADAAKPRPHPHVAVTPPVSTTPAPSEPAPPPAPKHAAPKAVHKASHGPSGGAGVGRGHGHGGGGGQQGGSGERGAHSSSKHD